MVHRMTGYRQGFVLCFASALLCLAPGAGYAAAGEKAAVPVKRAEQVTASYEIYGGGIRALTADFSIAREKAKTAPSGYELALASRTTGLVRFLTPWRGTLTSDGTYQNGVPVPHQHESIAVWPDNTHVKRFTYTKDGKLDKMVASNNGKDEKPENAAELMDGTADVMTAALRVMEIAARDGTCDDQVDAFDGKRRLKLITHSAGTEELKSGRYNVFGGSAIRCEVEMVPEGGDWNEKMKGWASLQEESQKQGSLPLVWLGRVEKDGPLIPVKVRVKTSFGTFLAHLTGYKIGPGNVEAISLAKP